MKKHKLIFFLAALSLFFLSSVAGRAAVFDPSRSWYTITTEHFFVRYPKEIETVAQDAARILEEVHAELSPELKWKPWGRTEVVLTDSTDDANGFTTILPYNLIVLYIVAPRPETAISNYDDWLRTLITHEYTHLLHIDAVRGFWKPFRAILGKSISPAALSPGWVREGFAVYEETDKTTAGRGRASYTEMLIRTAVLENDFPSIDRADGVHWEWPSYNVAYLFGGKFISYLIDTYGEDKFLKFNTRLQGSPMLSMVNHQARNVYHKTFYELWREWQSSLRENYEGLKTNLEAEGITETSAVVKQAWDDSLSAPTPSPDGKKLAYLAASPHRSYQHKSFEIRIKDLKTDAEEVIAKQSVNRMSWSPDGAKIAYSASSTYKRYNSYFDLWIYDVGTKKATPLTSGVRARDPDFDPTGKEIVFVSGKSGTDILNRINVETREITQLTDPEPKYISYAEPRISRDGKFIAVSVKKDEEKWKIYVYSVDGRSYRRLTNENGMETSPWWSPDGIYVFYTSDESGIPNVYRTDVESGATSKLSNVLTGVYEPTTCDGRKIFVREYHSKGFVISSFEASPPEKKGKILRGKKKRGYEKQEVRSQKPDAGQEGEVAESSSPGEETQQPEEKLYPTKKYSPFGKALFLPRALTPNVAYIEDAVFVSLMTGGAGIFGQNTQLGVSDPLRRHNWIAGGTYRTDARHFGYFGNYWYSRWRPNIGVGINDYAVDFGKLRFPEPDGTTRTVDYFEERRNLNAFMSIPVERHNFGLNYFYEDRMPKTTLTEWERSLLNLGIFSGFIGSYQYSDFEQYPASISQENGRTIRLTGMITNSVFGSGERNEQEIFAGDWREYIRLWRHHVLGLRAAGGMTWGDRMAQGTFGLGGAIGEGNFASGSMWNYFALRGLPYVTLSRTRAMLLSAEYRLPIVSPQRGIGTWPFFLQNMHAAFFADYGNAWNAHEDDNGGFVDFFDDFMLGVGAELRGDFVIGHGIPIIGRLGYGIIVVNRDRVGSLADPILGSSLKYGTLILQLGTSF